MHAWEFFVTEGPSRGGSFEFPGDHFTLGSGPGCGLRFDAPEIEPQLAEVTVDADSNVWVRDLSRASLMQVNGRSTAGATLPADGLLRFGPLELQLLKLNEVTRPKMGSTAPPTEVLSAELASTSQRASAAQHDATARRPTPWGDKIGDEGPGAPAGLEPSGSSRPNDALVPGEIIHQRYRITGRLASGGMGEVYGAEHVELGKPLALKIMRPELSHDPDFVARFKREAIAASRIGQQNIIDISDFGQTESGRFFFVMELLDGLTLSSLIHREGPLPLVRTLQLALQVSRALAAAHAQGIVHRDLKPENVMVLQRPEQPDFVKVLDFGVAKVISGRGHGGQTSMGMVVGTPQYMSPEQAKGLAVDHRTDIYALGLILYELLAGQPAFTGETPPILMVKQITEAPPPLVPAAGVQVTAELRTLISAMLEKDAERRPQRMLDVIAVLEASLAQAQPGREGSLRIAAAPSAPSQPALEALGTPARLSAPVPVAASLVVGTTARRSVLPRVAAGVVALGALGALALTLGRGGEAQVAVKPVPTPTEVPAAPAVAAMPRVVPENLPAPKPVTVRLVSTPARVEVYEGDALLGTTPLEVTRHENSEAALRFAAKGYKEIVRTLRFASDTEVGTVLEKDRGPSPRPRTTRVEDADSMKDAPY